MNQIVAVAERPCTTHAYEYSSAHTPQNKFTIQRSLDENIETI